MDGKEKMLPCFFRLTGDFASAEATKGLSGRPLETFGDHPLKRMGTARNRFLVQGKGRSFLAFFCFAEGFASEEATRGLSDRPLDPFGPPCLLRQMGGL